MITREFIGQVHAAFDELNYHETKQLDFDKFNQAAFDTLARCKTLSDAQKAIRIFQFCIANWKKIEKIFHKKISLFNRYGYTGNSVISVVPREEAYGTYYITNGLYKNVKAIFVASSSINARGMFMLGCDSGKFTIFYDGNYCLKFSKSSSNKMKLYYKNSACLCNIVLSKGHGIYLEQNSTPYELVVYEDCIGVYDRQYINSLAPDDTIDTNKLLAVIEWNTLKKDSKFGIAKLNVYAENLDLEMLLLFTTSTFLLFWKQMQDKTAMALTMASLAINSSLFYKSSHASYRRFRPHM